MTEPSFLLSPEAMADLSSIMDYIASRSGRLRPEQVLGRLTRTLAALAYSPGMGRRTDLEGQPFMFPLAPWIIFYEPEPELTGIQVLRVYDGRRDLERLLLEYKRPQRVPRE